MRLAVVVPVFNEAAAIASTLARLAALRARGARVIVVDGGSTDATAVLSIAHADQVLQSERGRAQQGEGAPQPTSICPRSRFRTLIAFCVNICDKPLISHASFAPSGLKAPLAAPVGNY